jgi:hypothetical protein
MTAAKPWLSFREAVEIVQARLDASIGRSEALVRAAQTSGEVRARVAGINDSRPGEAVLLLHDDGILGVGHATAIRLSENDLLDWLDRQQPIAVAAQPRSGVTPSPAARASKPGIEELVTSYLGTPPPHSQPGLEKFAKANELKGHRKALRDEFNDRQGHPGRGRPPKK